MSLKQTWFFQNDGNFFFCSEFLENEYVQMRGRQYYEMLGTSSGLA